MICQFNHQPCKYIDCPLWDEDQQRCLFQLAILKILAWPVADLGQPPLLTGMEKDILVLMSQGCRNSKIAEAVGIKPRAVSIYIADILVKLGAKNRAHAVTLAVSKGIITLSEDHERERIHQ